MEKEENDTCEKKNGKAKIKVSKGFGSERSCQMQPAN